MYKLNEVKKVKFTLNSTAFKATELIVCTVDTVACIYT